MYQMDWSPYVPETREAQASAKSTALIELTKHDATRRHTDLDDGFGFDEILRFEIEAAETTTPPTRKTATIRLIVTESLHLSERLALR